MNPFLWISMTNLLSFSFIFALSSNSLWHDISIWSIITLISTNNSSYSQNCYLDHLNLSFCSLPSQGWLAILYSILRNYRSIEPRSTCWPYFSVSAAQRGAGPLCSSVRLVALLLHPGHGRRHHGLPAHCGPLCIILVVKIVKFGE